MNNQDEFSKYDSLQRLLQQIREHVQEYGKALQRDMKPEDRNKLKIYYTKTINSKLSEFKQFHWRVYEETNTNQLARSVRQTVQQNPNIQKNPLDEVTYSKEGILQLREKDRFFDQAGFEVLEFQDKLQKQPNEITVFFFRCKTENDKFWYTTLFCDVGCQTIFDLQVSLLSPEKPLSSITKVQLENETIIMTKISQWIRLLYFQQSGMHQYENQVLGDVLRYTLLTMRKLFGGGDNIFCSKCNNYFKMSSNKKDGFLPPFIYFHDTRVNNESFLKESLILHDSCFFE